MEFGRSLGFDGDGGGGGGGVGVQDQASREKIGACDRKTL